MYVLVPLPSLVAIVYHLLNLSPRFGSRMSVVEAYRGFVEEFDQVWSGKTNPPKVSEDLADDPTSHQPKLSHMIWSAALLLAVFMIPAITSRGGSALMPGAKPALTEGQLGVVYAGLGVWILIVMRTIGRINAGGLNARFMMNAALRSAIAMAFGYFAGSVAIFSKAPLNKVDPNFGYFVIGLFYPWFYDYLKDTTSKLFNRDETVKNLSLEMVDGVDDDVADILTELNVSTVQHLATADPGILTVRSLYPFGRVVDWIDQAILITYFRDKIAVLRTYGVRGSIDFVSLMEQYLGTGGEHDQAVKTLTDVAGKLEITVESLVMIGVTIYYDYRVNLLNSLWQHAMLSAGFRVQVPKTATTTTPTTPTVPITQPVTEQPTVATTT